jgi:hypothetical protein
MADASTCELLPSHPPKARAINTFTTLLPTIKQKLIHLRHTHDAHEPSYFAAVKSLSDDELTSFTAHDLVAVRAGDVAYGVIIFGKVKIPEAKAEDGSQGYVFVRWFVGGNDKDGDGKIEKENGEVDTKFHSIYTEEKPAEGGDDGATGSTYRAIMGEQDELFFFSE